MLETPPFTNQPEQNLKVPEGEAGKPSDPGTNPKTGKEEVRTRYYATEKDIAITRQNAKPWD